MINYEVIWNGRGPLPGMTGEGFNYRDSYLTVAAEGNIAAHGLPSSEEMKGKGVQYDPRELRNYRAVGPDHACACGKGIADEQWKLGAHQCYKCAMRDMRTKARVAARARAYHAQR